MHFHLTYLSAMIETDSLSLNQSTMSNQMEKLLHTLLETCTFHAEKKSSSVKHSKEMNGQQIYSRLRVCLHRMMGVTHTCTLICVCRQNFALSKSIATHTHHYYLKLLRTTFLILLLLHRGLLLPRLVHGLHQGPHGLLVTLEAVGLPQGCPRRHD